MLIVVKIGTNSVIGNIEKIAKDIYNLKKDGHDVILVSSGAVGMGRVLNSELKSSPVEKQVLASIGQVKLMNEYAQAFAKYNIIPSQILITKKDIEGSVEHVNIENLMYRILQIKNIVPIINENDSVSLRELMFTDNDEIAGMIASKFSADKLIILTNVDGVYDNYESKNRKIISKITDVSQISISQEKSSMGRGGMTSKFTTCVKLADLGISSTIANVNVEDILQRVAKNDNIGTSFVPKRNNIAKKSKRIMAFESGISAAGKIYMNPCFSDNISVDKKIMSILPIGVQSYSGEFQKRDIIEIYNHTKKLIGYGVANVSHKELHESIGKKSQKPLVRYENLFILKYGNL